MRTQIEAEIRNFIAKNYQFRADDPPLGGTESLLEAGLIDSTGVLELLSFLDERFGIRVEYAEMTLENLDSVDGLVGFVRGKLGADAAVA